MNPAKVKEKLVDQLKTQIIDLERFISFLQGKKNFSKSDLRGACHFTACLSKHVKIAPLRIR